MNSKKLTIISFAMIMTLLLSACNILAPQATPTVDQQAMQATLDAAVTQAVEKIGMDMTSTALVLPTSTVTATPEPTFTVTVTPTVVIPTSTPYPTKIWPSATVSPTPSPYSCIVVAQVPTLGASINISTAFYAKWTFKNTGTKKWEVGHVDLLYVSGQKMQTVADGYDLPSEVLPGGEYKFVVDMKTPATAGTYKATWALTMEGITMCTAQVEVKAVKP